MYKDFIETLKNNISIVDIISKKIKLIRKGHDFFGMCPFHAEKTASFKVDPDKGMYYCFGCGAHGDVIKFVVDHEKMTFPEAIEYLAATVGMQVPQKHNTFVDKNKDVKEALTVIKNWFASNLRNKVGESALEYISSRKISDEYINKFELGFAGNNDALVKMLKKSGFSEEVLLKTGVFIKKNVNFINRYDGRLIFPIMDMSGQCVAFGGRILDNSNKQLAKYINSPESDMYVKSNYLYGYHYAKKSKSGKLILVEGYLDVISMHQEGMDFAVAPLGTSISDRQISLCWKITDSPIIALDGDQAGIKASYRWIDKIFSCLQPGKSFYFSKLPEGMDPDSLVSSGNIAVINNAIKGAQSLVDWMWDGAFMLYPSQTPEQKAAIKKTLLNKIEAIGDFELKKLYETEIKNKFNELYQLKKYKRTIDRRNSVVLPVISSKEKIEKIFIVTLINHPHIIAMVIEDIVNKDFTSKVMNDIKRDIINNYNSYYLNSEFEKYFEYNNLLKLKISEFEADVVLHASFAAENAKKDDVISGWNSFWDENISLSCINHDLQNATSVLQSSFSDDDWQRLKALKTEMLLNKVKK